MPTVSFYLKNEDYDKWRELESPGAFIHNALNHPVVYAAPENLGTTKPVFSDKPIKTPKNTLTGASSDLGTLVGKMPEDVKIRTPKNFCKQHQVDKSVCKMMVHKK